MTQAPSFELMQVDLTEEDFQEQLTAVRDASAKFFKPGIYDLVIKTAEWHNPNQHDPSWYGLKLTLGDNTSNRTIRQFISVPTKSVRYNKPGIKNPLGLFMMFREFVEGMGVSCQVDDVPGVLKNLFSDIQEGLVGNAVNVTIGYKAPYIENIAPGQFKVFEKDGREYKFDTEEAPIFADRSAAIAEVQIKYGLDLSKTYPEILKFNKIEDDSF